MFLLTLERMSDGRLIPLTHSGDEMYDSERTILDNAYQLTEVDGIEVPEIDMATYDIASIDGSRVSNIKMPDREISVTFFIRPNIEQHRRAIHQLCRVRSVIRLHFVTDGGAKYIDGYVKSIDSDRFSNLVEMTVTFICPDPYFKSESSVIADMSRIYSTFFFPFGMNRPVVVQDMLRTATINSVSENETGIIIRVTFLASADKITIRNTDTGEYLTVSYGFSEGDILEINTIDGQKDIILYHDDDERSIIAYVADGSTFFQLNAGDNRFNYIIDDNEENTMAEMVFDFTPIYMAL